MAELVVTWSVKALKKFDRMSLWYLANCGESFVKTFAADIQQSAALISAMPQVGRLRKREGVKEYRLYRNHPRCLIYYWHDPHALHVIDLIFTKMQARP